MKPAERRALRGIAGYRGANVAELERRRHNREVVRRRRRERAIGVEGRYVERDPLQAKTRRKLHSTLDRLSQLVLRRSR